MPLDASNGLAFGFLDGEVVDQLAENNQWKERSNAIEKIEANFLKLMNDSKGQ